MKNLKFLCLVVLAAGCGGKSAAIPPTPLEKIQPEAVVRQVWSADMGDFDDDQFFPIKPAIANNTVYTVDQKGNLSSFDINTGKRHWLVKHKLKIISGVAVGDGLLVIGTSKGEVIAIENENGTIRWRSEVNSEVLAPAVIHGNTIVVQTTDGNLYALSTSDGKRQWNHTSTVPPLSLRGTSIPTIYSDIVLTGLANGKVIALNLSNGRVLWEKTVSEPEGGDEIARINDVDSPLLIHQGRLFAVNYQGKLIAVSLQTGSVLWSREVSAHTGMDIDYRYVFLTDESGHVVAYDQNSGAEIWRQDKLQGRKTTAPTYINGHLIIGDYEGWLHWLSAEDGHFIARYKLGKHSIQVKALSREELLIAHSSSGKIVALRLDRP
jgi:outer membrane protein assembly factor BamB